MSKITKVVFEYDDHTEVLDDATALEIWQEWYGSLMRSAFGYQGAPLPWKVSPRNPCDCPPGWHDCDDETGLPINEGHRR